MWSVIIIFEFIFIACAIFYSIHSFFSDFLEKERLDDNYKRKFGLNKLESKRLRELIPLIKSQYSQDFCIEETIRLYLRIFRKLPVSKQINIELNKNLMQYCIHLIREKYTLKHYYTPNVEYMQAAISEEVALVQKESKSILPLTDDEEKILFSADTERWLRYLWRLTYTFDLNNPDDFYGKILRLASLNRDIRLVDTRNILYKSYLFMVKCHKATSLKLYLHYLNVRSTSATFKHKQICARNTSKLFNSKEQKAKFDAICKKFQKDNKLENALSEIETLCVPVRKKISLNIDSIQEANAKQAKMANVLSAYLDDEPTVETPAMIDPAAVIHTSENNQQGLFDLFISNAYRLNQQEINIFVQSKGLFKDQFIESINEQYYETLDDLLIEEEGDEYILNEAYYQQVNRMVND